jgi:hypothetical protein
VDFAFAATLAVNSVLVVLRFLQRHALFHERDNIGLLADKALARS